MAQVINPNTLLLKSDKQPLTLAFFNLLIQSFCDSINGIGVRMDGYDAAEANLVNLGLANINSTLGPFLTTLQQAASLGFLVCEADGIAASLSVGNPFNVVVTSSGASLFTPTKWLTVMDVNDSTNWGVVQVTSWITANLNLATTCVYASKTQTSSSWQIACGSGIMPAMASDLSQANTAATNASNSAASAASNAAYVASVAGALASGPVASVAGKTGAVTLVEGDISNLVSDLSARPTTTTVNTQLAGKQAASTVLTALGGLAPTGNQLLLATSSTTFGLLLINAFMQPLLNSANAAAFETSLGISAYIQTLLTAANAAAAQTTLGLGSAATQASTAFVAAAAISSFMLTVTSAANAAAARTTLGAAALAPGVVTITDAASTTFNAQSGATAVARLSAAGNRTITAPTNPVDGQKVILEHTASGAARTLTLTIGAGAFDFGTDLTTLSQTASGATDEIGLVYNSSANLWRVVAVTKGF